MAHLFFKPVVAGALAFSLAAASHAAEPFKISVIKETRSNDLIKVGRDWRKDLQKRIQVTLRVAEETPASAVTVKAYFYDKDDQLVFTAAKPNAIWTSTPKGIQEVLLPPVLLKGKPADVYFALPEELEQKKWKSMLVVFGNATHLTARSRPAAAIDRLKFPEEDRVRKEKD